MKLSSTQNQVKRGCRVFFWRLLLLGCILPVAGCRRAGDLDDKERNNRIVAKAYEMAEQGDYTAAVLLFNKALEAYPTMARPHLDLALILHDHQKDSKDYMRAIYHYQRYLELRPGSDKDDMINERIRQAERAFVAQRVTVNGVDGSSAMQLLEENQALRLQVEALKRSADEHMAELTQLREAERQRLRATVTGIDSTTVAGATVPDESAVVPVEPDLTDVVRPVSVSNQASTIAETTPRSTVPRPAAEPVSMPEAIAAIAPSNTQAPAAVPSYAEEDNISASGKNRTYTVQRGDSLMKIANKVYGDATRYRGIQKANHMQPGDLVVRVGQVLIIP